MIKALIILPKTSRYSPAKVGNFLWSDEHQAHLWDGRALDLEEFNRVSKDIFYDNRRKIEFFDLPPYVQLIDLVEREEVQETEARPVPGPSSSKPRLKRKLIPIPAVAFA
ncbi:MAG: hypothetical protein WCK57_00665 [Verrucomicrobiae bacterium]